MEIKKLDIEKNDEVKAVFLGAVLMQNGEIIRHGKTISFDKKVKGVFEEAK